MQMIAMVVLGVLLSGPSSSSGTPPEINKTEPATSVPGNLHWAKDLKTHVEEATALVNNDPVMAFLKSRYILNDKKPSPRGKGRAWLETQVNALEPKALRVLQENYETASRNFDVNGVVTSWLLAGSIRKESLTKTREWSEGGEEWVSATHAIWRVTDVHMTRLGGQYRQEAQFPGRSIPGDTTLTIAPKDKGCEIVRVNARVENISDGKDPAYFLWGYADPVLIEVWEVLQPDEDKNVLKGSFRWLNTGCIAVLIPGGALSRCLHAPECKSETAALSLTVRNDPPHSFPTFSVYPDGARTRMEVISDDGWASCTFVVVASGKKVDVGLLFAVPKGASGLQLLVNGSPPVAIEE